MLNRIWVGLMLTSFFCAVYTGNVPKLVQSITDSAYVGFKLAIDIGGLLVFWLGIMRIAEQSKLVEKLGHFMRPLLKKIFPDIPDNHPAMGSVVLTMSANILGLGNAATPIGIKAMEELQELNTQKDIATNSMCMFVAINASSIQIIPATTIALLAKYGSTQPTKIILPILIATIGSTTAAVVLSYFAARRAT